MGQTNLSVWRGQWRSLLLEAALFFCLATGAGAASKGDAARKAKSTDDIFTSTNVVRLQIEIPKEGMETLRKYRWRGWGGGEGGPEREIVKGTVREGGRVYTNVGIHMKGAAGSFRPIDADPALTLNFDKFVKGQAFHGLEKISLNNSVQDPTYLNEKICREMFEAAGVPVPRSDHAVVELNGRKLGLYVLAEGFNKQFLKRYFKNAKGHLYDGGFLKDINDELALSSGDNPKDRSLLKALAEAAAEPNSTTRFARLEKVLDMDRFISLLAMEMMQCHWDGYALNKNNYRLYCDPDSKRVVFMPHGLDQMFGVLRSSPSMSIMPRMEGSVARALMQTSEGRKRYLERMSQLLNHVLKAEVVTNRVYQLAAKINPILAERNAQSAKRHQRDVADFCERIAQRAESIQQQLSVPSKELKFDDTGMVKLSGWKSKLDFGKPAFADDVKVDGKAALRVSAEQGSSVGSWRTKVFLEGGRYRIEGKVKTQGVTVDPGDRRGGAGFRIAPRRFAQVVTGTTDWTNLGFDFEVQEGLGEVELACELRAAKGEVWFDTESLKLIRK